MTGRARAVPARGQAMTEFALVAPILFLLLFGIIQFGLLFGGQTGLVNAVRNTARAASTWPIYDAPSALAACPAIRAQLDRELGAALPGFQAVRRTAAISFAWFATPGAPATYGVRISIVAGYAHQLFIPLVGAIVDRFDGASDGSWRLTAAETIRIENPPLTTTGSTVTCP